MNGRSVGGGRGHAPPERLDRILPVSGIPASAGVLSHASCAAIKTRPRDLPDQETGPPRSVMSPSMRSVDRYSCRASAIQGRGDAPRMGGPFEADFPEPAPARPSPPGPNRPDLLRPPRLRRERGRPPSSDRRRSGLHVFARSEATRRHRNWPGPTGGALHGGERSVSRPPCAGIAWHRRETPREARRRRPSTASTSRARSLPRFEAIR